MRLVILICFPLLRAEAGKYHQSDYTGELTRVQVVNYSRSYFTDFYASLVYFNRTYRGLNASTHLIKDLGINMKIEVQVYKFLSNEYRFFPVTFEVNGCKEMQQDDFGIIESYQKSANFNLQCPFKKGFLTITYGRLNFSNFPPYMPAGEYKSEIRVTDNFNFLFECHWYFKIEELKNQWNHLIKKLI